MPKKLCKYEGQSITIGSVTDPYQPIEKRYELTRKILLHLCPLNADFYLITKSPLIVRDIDLFKRFHSITILLSTGFHEDHTRQLFEARTASIAERLQAAQRLHQQGIKVILFISPILPEITDWRYLIECSRMFVDEFWFENLNLYPSLRNSIFYTLGRMDKALVKKYMNIYSASNPYWDQVEMEIKDYCQTHQVPYQLCFHHDQTK